MVWTPGLRGAEAEVAKGWVAWVVRGMAEGGTPLLAIDCAPPVILLTLNWKPGWPLDVPSLPPPKLSPEKGPPPAVTPVFVLPRGVAGVAVVATAGFETGVKGRLSPAGRPDRIACCRWSGENLWVSPGGIFGAPVVEICPLGDTGSRGRSLGRGFGGLLRALMSSGVQPVLTTEKGQSTP